MTIIRGLPTDDAEAAARDVQTPSTCGWVVCAVIALYDPVIGLGRCSQRETRAGPGNTPYSAERAPDLPNSMRADTLALGG